VQKEALQMGRGTTWHVLIKEKMINKTLEE
jgi:hypothetical protein